MTLYDNIIFDMTNIHITICSVNHNLSIPHGQNVKKWLSRFVYLTLHGQNVKICYPESE